ncbi:MAG: D-alanyl-D-alanine carboxypeptidase, partial [Pseudomonadota bacterium]|nr:D-alanyl-D-alanine carboxypeptidase [Pseudomonadota bacterium]
MRILLAAVALLFVSAGIRAADPNTATSRPEIYLAKLAAARIPADAAAVIVWPLDDGALEYTANPKKPMNPASTMKLVTTYSALHLLGPAFTFRTEVFADGPVTGDSLRGRIHIRGGGDPKLVIEDLWLLVNRMRGFGIREIGGDVVLDKSFFAPLRHDPAQFDGEEGRAYNVGPDALLVNFKSIGVTFVPDTAARVAHVIVIPEVAGMKFPKSVPA